MDNNNPFATLLKPDQNEEPEPSSPFSDSTDFVIQHIFRLSCRRDCLQLPCVIFMENGADSGCFNLNSLDQVLFDRLHLDGISQDNVIRSPSCTEEDFSRASTLDPLRYLFDCFCRSLTLSPQIQNKEIFSEDVKSCQAQIYGQVTLCLLLDVELESNQACQSLYQILHENLIENGADDQIANVNIFFSSVIDTMHMQIDNSGSTSIDLSSQPIDDSMLKALRPLVALLVKELKSFQDDPRSPSNALSTLEIALGMNRGQTQNIGRKARLLFLPERRILLKMATFLATFPVTAELLIEASFPPSASTTHLGREFEDGLLGRFVVPSHMRSLQSMQESFKAIQSHQESSWAGEFFTDQIPLKHSIEADQRTIWQLTRDYDSQLEKLFKNILKSGKRRTVVKMHLLRWFGQCLHANKARKQLSQTISNPNDPNSSDTASQLASDGFLQNLSSLLVSLCGPLISSNAIQPPQQNSSKPHPLSLVLTSYVTLPNSAAFLPDLAGETRLTRNTVSSLSTLPPESVDENSFPLLTHLFFLAQTSFQLSFPTLLSLHFETNRQLHQLEQESQLADPNSSWANHASQQERLVRYCLRERTSRFIEQTTTLGCISRLVNYVAFAATTCIFLVELAKPLFSPEHTKCILNGCLSQVPEFIVDNIVELISYLRRLNDDFLETSETADIPLAPFLKFAVVFMANPIVLANPHLRARLGEILETLIPLRYEESWNRQRTNLFSSVTNVYIRREQLMVSNDEYLDQVITALLTAFVSIELTPGSSAPSALDAVTATGGNNSLDPNNANVNPQTVGASARNEAVEAAVVSFEEKFHYRRPMYACLRFWHGKPFYDTQFKVLENSAMCEIDNPQPPLLLQFLSLLINDATFLLDEAIGLLVQIKKKELEREAAGGRLPSREDEGLFVHMGRLAQFHITLGLDTIFALRRVVSLCPRLVTHPILVDRIACMMNYFLSRLVGPKQGDLKVRDKSSYGFRPDLLVVEICKIYTILGISPDEESEPDSPSGAETSSAFRKAVVSDGRSYTKDLLNQTLVVLNRVCTNPEISIAFEAVAKALREESAAAIEDEVDVEDAPEDFCDPIMGYLMEDPVRLPTSNKIVDRKTIYRHLLGDGTDPFNRQPLQMSMVEPMDQLRSEIKVWLKSRRAERQNTK